MADELDLKNEHQEGGGGHDGGGGHGAAGGGHKKHAPHPPHEEGHEGAPEWLISFADNVMLQMGFFVILLALALKSTVGGPSGAERGGARQPSPEQLDFAIAVREAFNNPVDINSTDPGDLLLVRRLRSRDGDGQAEARQAGLRGGDHEVQWIRPGEAVNSGGQIPFESHSAALTEAGRAAVTELTQLLRGCRTMLEVRGHCSAAEAFEQPDRGMRLAYERAFVVAQALVEGGLSWEQLRLTACGANERVTSPSYDKVAQRSNQRVEVAELEQAAPNAP